MFELAADLRRLLEARVEPALGFAVPAVAVADLRLLRSEEWAASVARLVRAHEGGDALVQFDVAGEEATPGIALVELAGGDIEATGHCFEVGLQGAQPRLIGGGECVVGVVEVDT